MTFIIVGSVSNMTFFCFATLTIYLDQGLLPAAASATLLLFIYDTGDEFTRNVSQE
jgi:hypothetical protein